ncbi:MAG: hypothetical protein LBQ96_02905 [Fusobacteriaceae bacterium]|nr:hypothetical protein [Fusobacteriaceae bacterium]
MKKTCLIFILALLLALITAGTALAKAVQPTGGEAAKFVGIWHGSDVVGAGYSDRWAFYPDGTYVFGENEMDSLKRTRYKQGTWSVSDGRLTLVTKRELIWEGGRIGEDPIYVSGKSIQGKKNVRKLLNPPTIETLPIRELPFDRERGLRMISIGAWYYWDYSGQPGIMDGYQEFLSDAGKNP